MTTLAGEDDPFKHPSAKQKRAMATPRGNIARRIIIAGAPGSGKGTQCEQLVKRYGLIHLSTGDILRARMQDLPELASIMRNGELVPDSIVTDIVMERVAQSDARTLGFVLDGFPRTLAQAQALTAGGVVVDHFLFLDCPDETVLARITGRRIDPVTGRIYHTQFNPPPAHVENRLITRQVGSLSFSALSLLLSLYFSLSSLSLSRPPSLTHSLCQHLA
jgi:adenylate kinase